MNELKIRNEYYVYKASNRLSIRKMIMKLLECNTNPMIMKKVYLRYKPVTKK
jgi:hypothetical protein